MDGFDGDWEEKQIGDVLTEEKRFIALEDETEYHLVTVKRRNEGIVSRGFLFGENILVKNYTRIRSGDYLISRRQIVHGANGLVPPTLDNAIVSNEYMVASENDEISTEFLTLLSQTPEMYRKFMLSSYGVDIEKMVFNVEDWKNRNIVIPRKSEQTAIGHFFRQLDDMLALQQRQIAALKRIKAALLNKMLI